jgi:hypothetical protein
LAAEIFLAPVFSTRSLSTNNNRHWQWDRCPAEKNATPVENKEVVVDDPPGRPMTTFFSRFVSIVT